MSHSPVKQRSKESGAFLLEALVGLLIFSFGILGIVALQAQAIRFTSDAEIRAEATYLANSLISKMWTEYSPSSAGRAAFKSNFEAGGAGYNEFKLDVQTAMPNGILLSDPIVIVDEAAPPIAEQSTFSSVVRVRIDWQLPGDAVPHNYSTTGVIGLN
jgi:type IV pilus assembly protein PilV